MAFNKCWIWLIFLLISVYSANAKVRKRQTVRPEPVPTTIEAPPETAVTVSADEEVATTLAPVEELTSENAAEKSSSSTKVALTPQPGTPSNWYEAFGQAAAFRLGQAFQRLKNAVIGRATGVTARFMESWMEGAMVPMSFLLMAAFIMDILQRLFPLPYASFVNEAYHHRRRTPKEKAQETPPSDLNKIQFSTPLGSIGFESNDKNPIHALFGRSQQGNPPVVPSGYQYQYPPQQEAQMDAYLNSILQQQQERVRTTLTGSAGMASPGGYPQQGGGGYAMQGSPQVPKQPNGVNGYPGSGMPESGSPGNNYMIPQQQPQIPQQQPTHGGPNQANGQQQQLQNQNPAQQVAGAIGNFANALLGSGSQEQTQVAADAGQSVSSQPIDYVQYYSNYNNAQQTGRRRRRKSH